MSKETLEVLNGISIFLIISLKDEALIIVSIKHVKPVELSNSLSSFEIYLPPLATSPLTFFA